MVNLEAELWAIGDFSFSSLVPIGSPQSEGVIKVSCMDIRMSLEKPGSREVLQTSCRK